MSGETAKTALVTGASSGIGRATAELMIARGWRVALTSRDPGALSDLTANANVAAFAVDLGDDASLRQVVAATVARFGGIDVLVNNAGYGVFGPLEGTTAEEVERQFRTNVVAAIDLIRYVLPVMRERGGGTIVNVSSIGGRTASPFASLYHASKFAIEGFSESFRYEASLHGIRVKLVEPAHFRTGFITRSPADHRPPSLRLRVRQLDAMGAAGGRASSSSASGRRDDPSRRRGPLGPPAISSERGDDPGYEPPHPRSPLARPDGRGDAPDAEGEGDAGRLIVPD